jgi:hypothetical protein
VRFPAHSHPSNFDGLLRDKNNRQLKDQLLDS